MNVFLVCSTPEPLDAVAKAATLCTSPADISKTLKPMAEKKADKLVRRVLDSGHESILEHVSFSFIAEGLSRACTHQLVRHRIASYSQQSQRYVEIKEEPDWIIPPTLINDEKTLADYKEYLHNSWTAYRKLIDSGLTPEDARMVLPNASPTRLILTMNARALLNFFRLRLCHRAQWEIRELAEKMLLLVIDILPAAFDSAGPGCVNGPCPEGKLTCGHPFKGTGIS